MRDAEKGAEFVVDDVEKMLELEGRHKEDGVQLGILGVVDVVAARVSASASVQVHHHHSQIPRPILMKSLEGEVRRTLVMISAHTPTEPA